MSAAASVDVAGVLLEARKLEYRYPDGPEVLRSVSFSLREGERLAVLGATGAGKSTLLLHLNGLLRPDRGEVILDSLPITDANIREVRRRVGLVFQNPEDQLFMPTLLEDVAFAPLNHGATPRDAEAVARGALREIGLAESAGRAAHHLSGGEQRLASLATVLVSRPRVLVLDEPTIALDAGGRRRIVEILRQRPETLVVATHDLEVAGALCGRGLVLADGAVAADGPLRDILSDVAFLEAHGLRAQLP